MRYATNFYSINGGESAYTPNTVTFTSRGDIDIFVMKYTASGDFTWAKTAGSVVEESMGGITYSAAANAIYICGSYKNALSFGPGLGTNSLTTVGSTSYFNGFLAKYNLNGNILWATRHGNTSNYHNFSGDIDANGNPYITGTLQYDSWFYSVNSSDNFYVRGVQYGEPYKLIIVIMEIYSSGVIRNKKENILQLGVPVISIKSNNRDFTYWAK